MSLSILTYNVAKGQFQPKDINRIVAKHKPDIICLQEFNSKVKDQLNFTKDYNIKEPKGKQGWFKNVTYSKYQIVQYIQFPTVDETRQILGIHIKLKGHNFWIINVHLSAGRNNDAKRKKQLASLLNNIKQNLNDPAHIVIVGDFNLDADEQFTFKSYKTAPLVGTYCNTNCCIKNENIGTFNHPFDRCVYKGLHLSHNPQLVGLDTKCSDHFGVIYTFGSKSESSCTIQ